VLGFAKPKAAIRRVKDSYKTVVALSSTTDIDKNNMGFARNVIVLHEPGIYQLIFKSKLPSAERFQEWIFEEVLPQIRATGRYVPEPKADTKPRALQAAEVAKYIMSILGENQPRLCQYLIDHAVSEILESLPSYQENGNQTESGLRGVVELAEEMGMPVTMKNRSQLGKFVRAQCEHLAKREKRLVNGTLREVYVYPDGEEIRDAIRLFFNR
jgi:hypothetical protein